MRKDLSKEVLEKRIRELETDLTYLGDNKWEGYIWDESFIYFHDNFHDRPCVFKFIASYSIGVELVYIVSNSLAQ